MKINEIVNAEINTDVYKKIAVELRKKCSPFLNEINGQISKHVLYRGTKKDKGMIAKVKCPVGREPVDTDFRIHEKADDWFYYKTGISYRSNALFATGSFSTAADYDGRTGSVYAVFPIGAFKFCWSPVIPDLYAGMGTAENLLRNLNDSDMDDDFEDEEMWRMEEEVDQEIDNVLTDGKYQTTDMVSAINSNHEVMIHCPEFYLIKLGNNSIPVLTFVEDELRKLK